MIFAILAFTVALVTRDTEWPSVLTTFALAEIMLEIIILGALP